MKYLFIIIVLLSFGCGPHVEIEYHTVSQEELWLRAGKHVDGWSTWKYEPISNDGIQKVKCNIYMMEKSWYDSWGEYFYMHVLDHEKRHCYEGKYHPEIGGHTMSEYIDKQMAIIKKKEEVLKSMDKICDLILDEKKEDIK